jgi:hypothetical protein
MNMVLKVPDNLVSSHSMGWHNGNALHLYLEGAYLNPGWDTSYSHWSFWWFSQSLQANAMTVTIQLLPFISFLVQHSLVIVPFNTKRSSYRDHHK